MKKTKLCIIGTSFLVYEMLVECTKDLPVEFAAISLLEDESHKAAERICTHYRCGKIYSDYRQMLEVEKPELVFLFPAKTDDGTIAEHCLQAGAYVFAERPICTDIPTADRLISLQKETNCYIMPRYNRRFAPSYMMAREILLREEFGRPDLFFANYDAFPFESEDSMLWVHLTHIIDLMIYLLGDLTLICAQKVIIDANRRAFNMTFSSACGAVGTIQSAFTQCFESPVERVRITGNNRNILVDNLRSLKYYRPAPNRKLGGQMTLLDGGDVLSWEQNNSQMSLCNYYGFEGCIQELVAAAREKRPPAFHMEDAKKTIVLLNELKNVVTTYEK